MPAWGKDRMRSMILERTDWCISRQRRWGLPIPVFYCKDCGKPVCTPESIEAVAGLFEKEGSNAWFDRDAADILPKGFTCPHCGKAAGFDKETDTLDGWFDSGSTHFAAMERDQGFWPATMYIEGLDQYRGWFQSSLLVAVGALGAAHRSESASPTAGPWTARARPCTQSLGNGMDPAEIFNKYGADLLRLWAGSSDYHVDVRCSDEIFKQLSQNYLKFRNTAKFCLDNLTGFDADHLVEPGDMLPLDKWAITRLNDLLTKAYAAYDNYEFHVVSHMINDFCVVDLSSFYFDILKDRLYCDEAEGLSRRSAQTALFLILDAMTRLFAPILAFTCDEIWLAMPHRSCDDARNVLFNEMVLPYNGYALSEDEMARWARIAALRTAVNGALETARADKTIGKSLEAEVDLAVTPEDGRHQDPQGTGVSQAGGGREKGAVAPPTVRARGKRPPTGGSDSEHPGPVCPPRCAAAGKAPRHRVKIRKETALRRFLFISWHQDAVPRGRPVYRLPGPRGRGGSSVPFALPAVQVCLLWKLSCSPWAATANTPTCAPAAPPWSKKLPVIE